MPNRETTVELMEFRNAWRTIQAEYPVVAHSRLEAWQRLEIYKLARQSGRDYERALRLMRRWPKGGLPEVVFEMAGGTYVES